MGIGEFIRNRLKGAMMARNGYQPKATGKPEGVNPPSGVSSVKPPKKRKEKEPEEKPRYKPELRAVWNTSKTSQWVGLTEIRPNATKPVMIDCAPGQMGARLLADGTLSETKPKKEAPNLFSEGALIQHVDAPSGEFTCPWCLERLPRTELISHIEREHLRDSLTAMVGRFADWLDKQE
jgi:hypothetical protein